MPQISKQSLRFSSQTPGVPGTTSGKGIAPDNFYDDEVETEKEFLDITTSLMTDGGINNLTRVKDPITWEKIEAFQDAPTSFDLHSALKEANAKTYLATDEEIDRVDRDDPGFMESAAATMIGDLVSHTDLGDAMERFVDSENLQYAPAPYIPEEYINYTIPWKENDDMDDPLLNKFVPNTAPEKFTYSSQGERACVGKLQRRGKEGRLLCHKIDLDDVSPLDVVNLRRFLSDDAEILSKKHTGLCSKCQRKVAKTIKTSRQIGMLPHIGQYFIEDSRPSHVDTHFHDVVKDNSRVESKTVF